MQINSHSLATPSWKIMNSEVRHSIPKETQRHCGAICVPIGFENGQLSDREMTAMTMRWAARSLRSERGHQTLASEVKDEIQIPEQTERLSSTGATLQWKFTEPRPLFSHSAVHEAATS